MQSAEDTRTPAAKRPLAQDAAEPAPEAGDAKRPQLPQTALAALAPGELQVALRDCADADLVQLSRAGCGALRRELAALPFWLERLAPRYTPARRPPCRQEDMDRVVQRVFRRLAQCPAYRGGGAVCDAMLGAHFYYVARCVVPVTTFTLPTIRAWVARVALDEASPGVLHFALTHVYDALDGSPPVRLRSRRDRGGVCWLTDSVICPIRRIADRCHAPDSMRHARQINEREVHMLRVWFAARDDDGRPLPVTPCLARCAYHVLRGWGELGLETTTGPRYLLRQSLYEAAVGVAETRANIVQAHCGQQLPAPLFHELCEAALRLPRSVDLRALARAEKAAVDSK